jgi:hypothetical protein
MAAVANVFQDAWYGQRMRLAGAVGIVPGSVVTGSTCVSYSPVSLPTNCVVGAGSPYCKQLHVTRR